MFHTPRVYTSAIGVKWSEAVPDGRPEMPSYVQRRRDVHVGPFRIDFLITTSVDLTSLTRVSRGLGSSEAWTLAMPWRQKSDVGA